MSFRLASTESSLNLWVECLEISDKPERLKFALSRSREKLLRHGESSLRSRSRGIRQPVGFYREQRELYPSKPEITTLSLPTTSSLTQH